MGISIFYDVWEKNIFIQSSSNVLYRINWMYHTVGEEKNLFFSLLDSQLGLYEKIQLTIEKPTNLFVLHAMGAFIRKWRPKEAVNLECFYGRSDEALSYHIFPHSSTLHQTYHNAQHQIMLSENGWHEFVVKCLIPTSFLQYLIVF